MVKKLPTIERSKTISIGEKILDNQADRSVVINASDEYINADSNNVYISPIQTVSDTGTFLAYDHITKRLINSDIGVTELLTNIHSTTLQLTDGNTSWHVSTKWKRAVRKASLPSRSWRPAV